MSELLTTREVASALRVTESTVRHLAKQGVLRRIEINSRLHRFDRTDVEALLTRLDPEQDEVTGANGDLVKLAAGVGDDPES